MERNFDMHQAVEAIRAASAVGIAASDMPQITGQASAQRGDPEATGAISETSTIGGGVSWALDLFGANLNARRATAARLDATYLTADVVQLVIQSGNAQAYIALRFHQASISLTRQSLTSRKNSLDLTTSQFEIGAVGRLDVIHGGQLVAKGEAQIPAYETGLDQALVRLATSTARRMADLRPVLQRGSGQPRPRARANVSTTAEVVRARPDGRAAERNYSAAAYAVGVAKARCYPSVALSGNIGATNISGGGGNITAWTLGPTINLPIFTGGENKANLRYAESRAVQAKPASENSVLNAVEEVESGLAACCRDGRNIAAQQRLVDASAEAVTLARTNFSVGDGAFFAVLDSERSLLQAQQALADAVRRQGANLVTLSAATAGGSAVLQS